MPTHGLQVPETIIQLDAARRFWEAVENYTHPRINRNVRMDLRASVESIRHKLNVIRCNAVLIQSLQEEDYAEFITPLFPAQARESSAEFQHLCKFKMQDQHEYRLVLTTLLENLSAAAFSLLDVCAHLLKELFNLPFLSSRGRPIKVSYKKALDETALQGYATLHNFLVKYRATPPRGTPAPTLVDWIDPLEKIRHQMTHRPITDILHTDSGGNLFTPMGNSFLINANFFHSRRAENIKDFTKRCYEGLEEFVIQLYEQLIIEVNNAGTVPV